MGNQGEPLPTIAEDGSLAYAMLRHAPVVFWLHIGNYVVSVQNSSKGNRRAHQKPLQVYGAVRLFVDIHILMITSQDEAGFSRGAREGAQFLHQPGHA